MAYQIQVARPGEIKDAEPRKRVEGDIKFETNMDEVLEKMMKPVGRLDRFGNKGVPVNVFKDGKEEDDSKFDLDPSYLFSNFELGNEGD